MSAPLLDPASGHSVVHVVEVFWNGGDSVRAVAAFVDEAEARRLVDACERYDLTHPGYRSDDEAANRARSVWRAEHPAGSIDHGWNEPEEYAVTAVPLVGAPRVR